MLQAWIGSYLSLKEAELVEAASCFKDTSSISVGSVRAEMYLAELCICSKIILLMKFCAFIVKVMLH
jgi:hypothetical protein